MIAHGIDVVMQLEYRDIYSKISGSLWQYYGDETALNDNNATIDFPADNNKNISFKFKQKTTGKTNNNGIKDVKIMVSLKYLSNFCRMLEIPLINCEISLMLTWSKNCFLIASTVENQNPTFTRADTKLYLPVVTLSTFKGTINWKKYESKVAGFKRTINRNKHQSKVTQQTLNKNLDFLIDPSFQGVNKLFVLSFEDRRIRASYKQYFLPMVEIKDYNVVIDRRIFFDQPVKNNLRT